MNVNGFIIDERGELEGYEGHETNLVIPSCVKEIGYKALFGLDFVETVTVRGNVKKISDHSFSSSKNLRRIVFEEGVLEIGESLSNCPSLTEVSLPDSLTAIDGGCFIGCDSLEYNLDGGVKYLGNEINPYVLLVSGESCPESYRVKENTRLILDEAFYENGELKSIYLPPSVRSVGYCAFGGTERLSKLELSEGLERIEACAFDGCNIKEVVFPDTLKAIEWSAVYSSRLERVILPESLTHVGRGAIGGSLKYNEYGGCRYLGSRSNPYLFLAEAVSKDVEKCVIHADTKIIGSHAFMDCEKLAEITLPEGVYEIGEDAFRQCYGLKRAFLPESLYSISDNAFASCKSLAEIELPTGEIEIGSGAFMGCESLGKISITKAKVGDNAFSCCTSLEEVNVGSGSLLWGDYIFSDCPSLKRASLPEAVRGYVEEGEMFDSCDLEIEYV